MNSVLLKKTALAVALAAGVSALVGCSSGEERQAQYYAKAKEFYEAGNVEKARVEVKNVLQINPENADARYLMALIEEREGNWQQVFPNLYKAIEINGSHIKARTKLGTLLIAMGGYKEGEEQAKEVIKLAPQDANGYLMYAGMYMKQNKPAEALQSVQEALKRDPKSEDAIGLLATVQAMTDLDKALATLDQAIKDSPKSAVLRLVKIRVLETHGKFAEVVPLYSDLVKEDPESLFYVRRLVDTLAGLKRTDEAEKALRSYVDAHKDREELQLWLIEFLASTRNVDIAEQELKGFIAKAPDSWKLQEGLGRLYVATTQYDKARGVYEGIRSKSGDKAAVVSATNQLIDLEMRTGKTDAADKLLAEVLATEPENPDALMQRARLRLAKRDNAGATADLRVVLKQTPDSVPALNLMAMAQVQAGAPDMALEHYDRALAVEPGNIEALSRSAQILLQQEQADRAEQRLKVVLARAPRQPEASQLLVDLYTRKQQWDKALALVSSLKEDARFKPMADYWLGVIELRRGRVDEGIAALQSSLQGAPRSADTLKALVGAYLGGGRDAEAVSLLEAHAKAHPDLPQAQDMLAQIYRKQGEQAKAVALYQDLITRVPKYLPAYLAMVEINRQKGDNAAALAVLDQADKQAPDAMMLSMVRAELHASAGQYDKARDAYEHALKLDPSSDVAKNNLAALLLERFNGEDVMRRVQSLIGGFETSKVPAFLDTAGWYHFKAGNNPQAISLLKAAVGAQGSDSLFRFHLGMAYYKDGQSAQAKEQLELALTRPTFEGADEAKRILGELQGH